jgi:hypothetical protein
MCFINLIKKVGFPGEGNKTSFADAQFNEVRSIPTLYKIDIRLEQSTILS